MLPSAGLTLCALCHNTFAGGEQFCPLDGTLLVPASPVDPLVGRTLGGRYRLDERIGRGGMGTVYRALHTRMEKPVAVKVLRADLAGDAEAVARFHREARSASRLDHENCIRVSDFGQSEDGLLYLAMELLDGESLGQRLARGPVPAPLLAAIGRDVALALQHAHDSGVIHRDLKPDNVMLVRRGPIGGGGVGGAGGAGGASRNVRTVVKVLDFGLAKIATEAGMTPTITKAGSVFGTPEYMAPEQVQSAPLDARSDLYSLGAMLYHLVTGELPLSASTFIGLLRKHVEEEPVPVRQRRPDLAIPVELEAVVMRCLAKDPAARFQRAEDVATALAAVAGSEAVSHALVPTAILARTAPMAAPVTHGAATVPLPDASSPSPLLAAAPEAGPSRMTDDEADPDVLADSPSTAALAQAARPRRARWAALGVGGLLASLGLVSVLHAWPSSSVQPASGAAATPGAAKDRGDPLIEPRRLIAAGNLDGAERLLLVARAGGDGAPLQMLLGEIARLRGNRLGALAHLHRATRLAPQDAEPHAHLAALLHQLDQRAAACREARIGVRLDPANATARDVVTRCEESR